MLGPLCWRGAGHSRLHRGWRAEYLNLVKLLLVDARKFYFQDFYDVLSTHCVIVYLNMLREFKSDCIVLNSSHIYIDKYISREIYTKRKKTMKLSTLPIWFAYMTKAS